MLSIHHGDDIHCLGRRNLVTSDSQPKVRCQSIPTTFAHSVLNPIFFYKKALLVLVILEKL